MQLIQRLFDHFAESARRVRVVNLTIGLSYTAVTTDDGGMGLAYTFAHDHHCVSLNRQYQDYEGEKAIELLSRLQSSDLVHRSMGLALVNALNYPCASLCPDDTTNNVMMDEFKIGQGTRVAMVGFFRPLMKDFKTRGASVEVLDDTHGIGERKDFIAKLNDWADVLLLTSTSILNLSTEELLGHLKAGVRTVMLGPSTPMVREAFSHLPVHMLAGTVPVNQEGALRAVRHGAGTQVIHRFSRKVYLRVS